MYLVEEYFGMRVDRGIVMLSIFHYEVEKEDWKMLHMYEGCFYTDRGINEKVLLNIDRYKELPEESLDGLYVDVTDCVYWYKLIRVDDTEGHELLERSDKLFKDKYLVYPSWKAHTFYVVLEKLKKRNGKWHEYLNVTSDIYWGGNKLNIDILVDKKDSSKHDKIIKAIRDKYNFYDCKLNLDGGNKSKLYYIECKGGSIEVEHLRHKYIVK